MEKSVLCTNGALAIVVNLIICTRFTYITLSFVSLGTEPRDSLYRYSLNSYMNIVFIPTQSLSVLSMLAFN